MEQLELGKSHFSDAIMAFIGTELGRCGESYLRLCADRGVPVDESSGISVIHFDHSPPEGGDDIELIDRHLLNVSFPVGDTISVRLPAPGAIEELEARGSLRHIPPELLRNHGPAKDELGTGGNLRLAAFLFEPSRGLSKKRIAMAIGKTRAYDREWTRIKEGKGKKSRGERVQMYVLFSTVGGTQGVLARLLADTHKVAEDLGVDIKVTLFALCLGTIEPPNAQQARQNQNTSLSYLLATATGCLPDLFFGTGPARSRSPLFDELVLLSNCNRYGEATTLPILRQMTAQLLFLLTHLPAGEFFRERAVDFEGGWQNDRFGAPRCASTMSLSVFSADRSKALGYCSSRSAEGLASGFLQASPDLGLKESTLGLVRRHEWVETDDESMASEYLSHLAELAGESAVQDAITQFRNHVGESRGWPRFLAAERAWQFVMQTVLPANIVPFVNGRAEEWLKEARQVLTNEESRRLRSRRGPADLVAILRRLHALLEDFEAANKGKMDLLSEDLRERLARIEETRSWGDRMKRAWPIVRWFQPFTIRRMAERLALDAEDAIADQVELEIRQVLASKVYPALQDLVSEVLSRAIGMVQHIRAARNACDQEAQRLLHASGTARAPLGVELVDEDFLLSFYEQTVREAGGIEDLDAVLHESFLAKCGSLEAFLDRPLDKLGDALRETCEPRFREPLERLGVETVLRQAAATPQAMREYVHQAIKESAGRIRAPGTLGAEGQGIKMLAAPDPARFDWLGRLCNELDPERGKWSLVSNGGDRDAIYFFQYRPGLSLADLIRPSQAARGVQDLRSRARQGPEPISALSPPPDPSRRDVEVTLAKAALAGALESIDGEGICFTGAGEHTLLGVDWAEAKERLRTSYSNLVAMHSCFARMIFADPDGSALDTEPTRSLPIDDAAVRMALAEAAELRRYAHRQQNAQPEHGGSQKT